MATSSVVIAQKKASLNAALVTSLSTRFQQVFVAGSTDELRQMVAKVRPAVAVLDLDLVSASEVAELNRNFSAIRVICTTRSTDSAKAEEAMRSGAVECYSPNNVRGITDAAERATRRVRSAAA